MNCEYGLEYPFGDRMFGGSHIDNLYYQNSRRFSYSGFLSNQSDASLSDFEQQTPSPVNTYVDLINELEDPKVHSLIDYSYPYIPMAEPSSFLNQSYPEDNFHKNQSALQSLPYGYPSLNSISNFGSPYPITYPPVNYNIPHFVSTQPDVFIPMASDMPSPYTPDNQRDFEVSFVDSSASPETFAIPVIKTKAKKTPKDKSLQKKQSTRQSKTQSRSRGRRSHDQVSDEDKSFQCKYSGCGKAFKRSEHLKRHARSIHTLEKPFECPYTACSKKFSRSDNLNQHIRIHRHTGKDKNMAALRRSSSSSESSAGSAHASCL